MPIESPSVNAQTRLLVVEQPPHIVYTVVDLLTDPPSIKSWSTLDFVDAKQLAEAKLIEVRNTYLEQEKNRFHVAKVITNELGEVWTTIDFESDPETGNYKVFNHVNGLYDSFGTLTDVKSNVEVKKQDFINSIGIGKVLEINVPSEPTTIEKT